MTPRTLLNISLAFALTGLVALAIYEPGTYVPPTDIPLTQLVPEKITTIRIQSSRHADIHLDKIDEHWKMTDPFSAPANEERIRQLLQVTTARTLVAYNVDKVNTAQLKLDTPSLTLTLNNTQLKFGGTAPLGGSRYVLIDNSVYLITDRYSHLALGAATKLISPTLLNTATLITGLQLPTLKLLLADGQWKLERPLEKQQAATNPDHLQQLLDEWRHARAFDVQALDTTLNNSVKKNQGSIVITTDNSTLRFTLLQTDDEIILQRPDLGLQYHFPQSVGQKLLTLPQQNDA